MSAFIVERSFKGFSSGTLTEKWGILAGNTGHFKMDGVEVPVENLVGQEGEGFKIAMFALDQGRYTVAAGATGLIRACRDASVNYARQRKTFGVEIGSHQLVKELIAQMESDYQASRLLWQRAGWLKNEGRRNTRETGLAKWFSTVASERAAGDAVQIHAMGITDISRTYRSKDLASGENIVFAATGVTDGTLMKGVRFFGDGIRTTSLVMQTQPHRIRFIDSIHVQAKGPTAKIRF